MAARVILDHRVEDGIADLICHLVGMTLCHRLGGKETSSHRTPYFCCTEAYFRCAGASPSVAGPADRLGQNLAGGRPGWGRTSPEGGPAGAEPRRRAARDMAHRESRAAARSQTVSASTSLGPRGTSVTAPSAASTTAWLSLVPNASPDPTWLTTSRSQPLTARLARPASAAPSVSAAKPTITCPARLRSRDSSRSMSGFSVSRMGSGAAPFFLIFESLLAAGR